MSVIKQRPLPFRDGGKWGYLNVDGGVIYPAEFEYTGDFNEGFGFARQGEDLLILNEAFQTVGVVQGDVHCYSHFQEGLLNVDQSNSQKQFYVDFQGRKVFEKDFDSANKFSNGRAIVVVNEKWGILDRAGRWVVEPMFDGISSFVPGSNTTCVHIREDEPFGYFRLIDRDGKFVSDKRFNWLGGVAEGRVPFRKKISKDVLLFGVADELGNELVPPTYTECDHCYSEGCLGVEVGEVSWGIIDKAGRWVIRPKYSYLGRCHDGLLVAYKGGEWSSSRTLIEGKFGFVNSNDETKINFQFDEVLPFERGIASVEWYVDPTHENENYDTSSGYVDCNGRVIWREQPAG